MKDASKSLYKKLLFSGIILLIILLMQPLFVYLLSKDIPVLFPKGIIAFKQRELLLLIQMLMLLFVIPIYIFTFVFSWWYRADNDKSTYDPHLVDHKIAEYVWWGLPFMMTVVVCIITFYKTHELDPFKPLDPKKQAKEIEVVALQWNWLFIYPEEKIASMNFVQFPKDVPVRFKITADAPMNAFWIPRLGGMIYAMPGMTTQLNLIADEIGEFRGSSSNISGKGFAGMTFIAKASSDEEYDEWIKKAKNSGKMLDIKAYKSLAAPTENHPVETFQLKEENLFNEVLNKFMKPNAKI